MAGSPTVMATRGLKEAAGLHRAAHALAKKPSGSARQRPHKRMQMFARHTLNGFVLAALVFNWAGIQRGQAIAQQWDGNSLALGGGAEPEARLQEVQVACGKRHMRVHLEFGPQPFQGLVFSKGHHGTPECVYVKAGSNVVGGVDFDVFYDKCGTKPDHAGSFYENTIVIQYGQDVIEAWDEAKRLRCEWHDAYEKSALKSPSIQLADLEVQELNFQGDNIGCWMEIQEGKGPWARQVSSIVPLGAPLTMVVAIADDDAEFDMRVKSCWAHDGRRPPLHLTDDDGCVLRPKMLTPFAKVKDTQGGRASVVSYSHFYAFKFPDTIEVQMQCVVEICRNGCPKDCASASGAEPAAPQASDHQASGSNVFMERRLYSPAQPAKPTAATAGATASPDFVPISLPARGRRPATADIQSSHASSLVHHRHSLHESQSGRRAPAGVNRNATAADDEEEDSGSVESARGRDGHEPAPVYVPAGATSGSRRRPWANGEPTSPSDYRMEDDSAEGTSAADEYDTTATAAVTTDADETDEDGGDGGSSEIRRSSSGSKEDDFHRRGGSRVGRDHRPFSAVRHQPQAGGDQLAVGLWQQSIGARRPRLNTRVRRSVDALGVRGTFRVLAQQDLAFAANISAGDPIDNSPAIIYGSSVCLTTLSVASALGVAVLFAVCSACVAAYLFWVLRTYSALSRNKCSPPHPLN